jgi:O-antigen/teichoic acid export membrane protein
MACSLKGLGIMFKAPLVYLLSNILGKGVPFLLLPLLTSCLNTLEFGIVAIVQLGFQFSQAFSGLSLNLNIPRKFFSQTQEEAAVQIFNLYLILIISCISLLGVVVVLIFLYGAPFGIPQRWLLAMPLVSAMAMSNLFNLTLTRTRQRPMLFMGFEVTHAMLNLGLTIYFVVFRAMSWEGRVLGISLATLTFGVIGLVSIMRQGFFRARFSWRVVRETLHISLPLVPHTLAGVIITVSDRLFIAEMLGLKELGIYSVGYSFGMVVALFSDAFIKAWSPWFYKTLNTAGGNSRERIVKYTYGYLLALCLGAVVYSLLATWLLPLVVADQYFSANIYIPWVCLSYVAFGFYQIFFPYLVYCNKTRLIAIATVTAASANLVCNYFLIGKFGAIGATYATSISFFISAVLVAIFATRHVEMPWRGQK